MKVYAESVKGTARVLRREGLPVREIARRLGVPKSTVGDWLAGSGEVAHLKTCWCGERFIARRSDHVSCCETHKHKRWRMYGPLDQREAA